MPRVTHFEIHSGDFESTKVFYGKLFAWTFEKWPGPVDYWVVKTGPDGTPGINGGLFPRHGPPPTGESPVISYVCSVDGKEPADAVAKKAVKLGATIAVPTMDIGGMGQLVYLKDPDGNIFGYMGPPAKAK